MLGSAVDLGLVEIDSMRGRGRERPHHPVGAGLPSSQLLGGCPRFVLSDSGHIQALVNPPGPESRRRYRVARAGPPESELWLTRR